MIQTLIRDTKHEGKYVALKSFDDHMVVGEGKNPTEAYDAAIKKGIKDPVLVFIPLKDMVQIY